MFSGGAAKNPTGAKMEAGEKPARSRHCDEGALLRMPLRLSRAKVRTAWEGEQGDDS